LIVRTVLCSFVISLLFAFPAYSQAILWVYPHYVYEDASGSVTVTGNGFAAGTPFYIGKTGANTCKATTVLSRSTDLQSVQILLPTDQLQDILISLASDCSEPQTVTIGVRQSAPLAQTLVGLDVAGASSTSPQAVFLGTATLDVPTRQRSSVRGAEGPWFGGQLKIAGMAQPGNLSNLSFSNLSGYFAPAANATPDKIVQSFEGMGFVAWQFAGFTVADGTLDSGTKPANTSTLFTVSAVVSGGALTPLSALQSNPPVYYATTQIQQMFPQTNFAASCKYAQGATPPCYVAFVPQDRTRFYRHYEGGFRLKIYPADYSDKTNNNLRFPGIVDVTWGQNEYVTGGKFQGVVMHIGGSLPIPYLDGAYAFGALDLGLSNAVTGPQLLLLPAPSSAGLTFQSPSVYTITAAQPNRDRYSFGLGLDMYHLIAKLSSSKKPS
jgi:hypothetical protein